MFISQATPRPFSRWMTALQLIAPLLLASAVALSSIDDVAEQRLRLAGESSGALRSVHTSSINLAALPASAFGDQD